MRILFVDDEAGHADIVSGLLRTVLDAEIAHVATVQDAVAHLQRDPVDLLIMDVFIPLGDAPLTVFGPRARRYGSEVKHLGGLVLLDELERLAADPVVLAHTACTEHALFEALGDRIAGRVQKPAGAEVMLLSVLQAMGLPVPG